jgi:hypothetical protein
MVLAAILQLSGAAWCAVPPAADVPDVAVLTVPLNADADPFDPVIAAAVELRLTNAGLNLDIRKVQRTGRFVPTNESLVKEAQPKGAAVVLICLYSVVGQEMTVSLFWEDVQQGTRASVPGRKAPVDLLLDAFILQDLDALIAQVQSRVEELAAKRREITAAALAAQAAATPQKSGAGSGSRETGAAQDSQGLPSAAGLQETGGEPAAGALLTVEAPQESTPRRFLVSTGIAPFIPVGEASSYASVGYMSIAAGDFVFPIALGSLALGLSLGVVSFAAEAASGTTTNFLLPLGVDARYLLGGSMASLLVHVSGGGAVFLLSSPTLGTRVKAVPFARGAVGVDLLFSRSVGVMLDVGYDVYFEMPLLLMGVSPALAVSLRL